MQVFKRTILTYYIYEIIHTKSIQTLQSTIKKYIAKLNSIKNFNVDSSK